MINETVAVVTGFTGGTMVSYILSFLFSVGVAYLTVLGAIKLFDGIVTLYRALATDVKAAKEEDVGLFTYWKQRISAAKPRVERVHGHHSHK